MTVNFVIKLTILDCFTTFDNKMELGISTFGELHPDYVAGKAVNAHRRVQELLEEVKLADEVGLDVFAFGEHHR
ncbi:MAG: class flavin-dependent oxidoreductase, partial [Mucilaginibacter sp.]|nr:class flavin-dependent oxidoreductase [Mucilaginibacter sp.]